VPEWLNDSEEGLRWRANARILVLVRNRREDHRGEFLLSAPREGVAVAGGTREALEAWAEGKYEINDNPVHGYIVGGPYAKRTIRGPLKPTKD
jgi:hypothetical protein